MEQGGSIPRDSMGPTIEAPAEKFGNHCYMMSFRKNLETISLKIL